MTASASASAAGARPPHPLQPLNDKEIARARDVLVKTHGAAEKLFFRSATLEEPRREDLVKYLAVEHGHEPGDLPVLARLARIEYDVIKAPGEHDLTDAVVDVGAGTIVAQRTLPRESQPSYTGDEFGAFQDACVASDMFKEAIKEFEIPENFTIAIDPWPYGPLEADEGEMGRTMQGLVFCRDASKNNLDSNHYAYPLPIIPIMDFRSKKVVRIDRLATGGRDDPLEAAARGAAPRNMFARAKAAEYVPELLERPLRTDLKPINITQPEGASFRVTDGSLVEWQKWRFRLGFTHREGAVLHDVCYDNRPLFLRVSFSEMTVPYADPRPPFHRKQAFDFGDGGAGHNANNLGLGCDCLGAIYYFDAWDTDSAGAPARAPNVVCLHEQDNGVGWKHTNFRTGRAVVTRLRELVVQFVITLANYEYIFAYKLDTAGGLTLETRATGIVSVVAIDAGKTSAYGNVVAPGVLAQNHQHIFAARLDPAVDSYAADGTRVVLEESRPVPRDPATNPHGNLYAVARDVVGAPRFADAEPRRNRLVRLESRTRTNPVSGKATGYKFTPSATQLLLADPASVQAARAPFAAHHVWVTGHRDNEFWAAGEWTNQSRADAGGVQDMVRRGDWFSDGEAPPDAGEGRLSTPVVWSVFGLTHNPRVEDWPVMPVEIHQVHIKPSDFFDSNPALDVPSLKNEASVLLSSPSSSCCNGNGNKAEAAAAHGQGTGPDLDPKEVVAR